jgi:hypothetical protein
MTIQTVKVPLSKMSFTPDVPSAVPSATITIRPIGA